jgi:hypothetical protein
MRLTRRRLLTVLALAVGLLCVPSAASATPPEVVHEQQVILESGTDLNICGDLAVFQFSGKASFTFVDMSDGVFHFQATEGGTYTVTFLDSSLGVWESRWRETASVQATPGGTFTLSVTNNSREGPVRIHELTTFVVGPDGTIRVDSYKTDVVGCPSG